MQSYDKSEYLFLFTMTKLQMEECDDMIFIISYLHQGMKMRKESFAQSERFAGNDDIHKYLKASEEGGHKRTF